MPAGKVMRLFPVQFLGENMFKDPGTECFQQGVLRFKMRIEGGSADIGQIYDLLNGDPRIALFLQQLRKSPENGLLALSLPAVHALPPEQLYRICSVSNESGFLIIVGICPGVYTNSERNVR